MVRVMIGLKGSGKTKQLIELVNAAVHEEDGHVVCLEHDVKLTYDLNHKARLIRTKPYELAGYDGLRGFVSGLYAGDYDITSLFLDSLFKIAGDGDIDRAAEFIRWLDDFGQRNGITFTVTISAPAGDAPEHMKPYIWHPNA